MPSNREIYEQGTLDAEQDDLNPFYYQHYYYYRKGYDEARRRLRRSPVLGGRRPTALLLISALVGLLLIGAYIGLQALGRGGAFSAEATAAPTLASTAAPPALPTPTARPTPPPPPSPTPAPQMAPGGRAQVADLSGSPLRLRAEPRSDARLLDRIPQGSQVTLLEGPVDADGYLWWRVQSEQGEGWSAGSTTDGATRFLEPIP